MQEHPKTGGVCAQMQPKRSKNNLQIFMQIFEYLTGHMMFKVGMKSFQLNQFLRQRQRSMWSGMCVALLDVFHFSVRAPSTRTRALTKMFLLLSICTRQWQRGKGTQERMISSISHQRTWMPCLWSRRGPLAVHDDHPGGFIWIFHLILLKPQRGWRIRYCALSDVFTQCPEELSEFLKQRRRWTVSGEMKNKYFTKQ